MTLNSGSAASMRTIKPVSFGTAQLFHFAKMIGLPQRAQLKHALSLNPSSVEAHLALAKLYWRENDLATADREFKAAAELAPPRSPAHLIYAEFKVRTGATDEAKVRLKEITRKVPDSLTAWRLAGTNCL